MKNNRESWERGRTCRKMPVTGKNGGTKRGAKREEEETEKKEKEKEKRERVGRGGAQERMREKEMAVKELVGKTTKR